MAAERHAESCYLTEQEFADRVRKETATTRRWRRDGSGPRYLRLPGGPTGRVVYRLVDILEWEETRLRTHTGQDSGGVRPKGPAALAAAAAAEGR
jgi:hypothetical protein